VLNDLRLLRSGLRVSHQDAKVMKSAPRLNGSEPVSWASDQVRLSHPATDERPWWSSLKRFTNNSNPLPATDANRRQPITPLAPPQLIQERNHQPRARRTQRMTEHNRSAIYSPIGVRLPPRMKTSFAMMTSDDEMIRVILPTTITINLSGCKKEPAVG